MGSHNSTYTQASGTQDVSLTTLDQGIIGQYYQVVSLKDLGEPVARRLESVGMTAGSVICVLNNKSHGTDIIRLRETRWALGRSITSCIQVRHLDGPPEPHRDLSPESVAADRAQAVAATSQAPQTASGKEASRG